LHPDLHSRYAHERLEDDHAGAAAADEGTATLEPAAITIRPARSDDSPAVELLAELDASRIPEGALLVAEVEGTVEAAVALESGETVANPFSTSGEAVTLLHVRADQLRAA
jgi:hypothetical protein